MKHLDIGKQLGVVTWFNKAKGYGEIKTPDNQCYFVTYEGIVGQKIKLRNLDKGDVVSFYKSDDSVFGLRVAEDVKRLEASQVPSSYLKKLELIQL